MTPTSIPSPQFVTKPWWCHDTLSSDGCVLNLGFSSLRRLSSASHPPGIHLLSRHQLSFSSALADCSIHLTSTSFSTTRSPAPCLSFSVPFLPFVRPS